MAAQNSEDYAITKAKALWSEKRPGDAVKVLTNRIEELNNEPQEEPVNSNRFTNIILIIIAFALVAIAASLLHDWTQDTSPTEKSPDQWWVETNRSVIEFLDSSYLADQTGRGNLAPVIIRMQELQHDYAAIDSPEKCSAAYAAIYQAMRDTTAIYISFMADDGDVTVDAKTATARVSWADAILKVQNLGFGQSWENPY